MSLSKDGGMPDEEETPTMGGPAPSRTRRIVPPGDLWRSRSRLCRSRIKTRLPNHRKLNDPKASSPETRLRRGYFSLFCISLTPALSSFQLSWSRTLTSYLSTKLNASNGAEHEAFLRRHDGCPSSAVIFARISNQPSTGLRVPRP